MAKSTAKRTVRCYRCHHLLEVGRKAQSVSCPHCNRPVIVEDVVIKGLRMVPKLQTCGKLVIQKSGRLIAGLIEAHGGVEVQGVLDGPVHSGGHVLIGPKARWKGDLRATSLAVRAGARIAAGRFAVPDHVAINIDTTDPPAPRPPSTPKTLRPPTRPRR